MGLNLATEYRRYLDNQDALWLRTGGMAWDGLEYPCMCRMFLHAHFRQTPGRHQEGARVPAEAA
eukprot:5077748-Heterocapsa_arctica.AAC.1